MYGSYEAHGYGYGAPPVPGVWGELDVINCTKIRDEQITCIGFDSSEELLWNGYSTGRVQSHIPPSFDVHSAFYANPVKPNSINCVRAIKPLANVVLSLGDEGFRIFTKGGALRYSSNHPSLYGLTCMSFNMNTNQMTFGGRQGRRSVISNFDLTSASLTEETYYDNESGVVSIVKHSPRSICCALSDGKIKVHDPRSLDLIASYQSHQGIYDMDVKNETIVTCGSSLVYVLDVLCAVY